MAFTVGCTPFGLFDTDTQFATDADKVRNWIARRLGEAHIQVELSASDVYACLEEATIEYSSIVNMYQAKSTLATLLGSATGSLTGQQNRYPHFNLEWANRQAQAYAEAVAVGGTRPLYSASVDLQVNQQQYDLQAAVSPTGSDGLPRRILVRDVYHYSPIQAFRYFGTTSGLNYLANQLQFESFTPETMFYLLPVWEDILRGMQFETSNRVRRSNYSHLIVDNKLYVYPPPVDNVKLWFTYQVMDDAGGPFGVGIPSSSVDFDVSIDGVSNLSNVPFGNIEYSKLNSISKTWIWKMTLAMCKETLGFKRRKFSPVPIPDGDLQLDGEAMVTEGKADMEALRAELRDILDQTTYDKLAAQEAERADALNRALRDVPMLIYVG